MHPVIMRSECICKNCGWGGDKNQLELDEEDNVYCPECGSSEIEEHE